MDQSSADLKLVDCLDHVQVKELYESSICLVPEIPGAALSERDAFPFGACIT